ncbi:MAG: PilZ domain-containing protein [Deltaproteobacteria bacterium]|jgi:c-di-GMP-binding flagellar brake protein YcgR|nr:PilZ domain-containing protein [Deltaproteobacteria bacterium]
MDLKGNNQFKKISTSERNAVFSDLVKYPEDIICKTDSDFFPITPSQITNSNRLYFKFNEAEKEILSGTEVVCQFIHKKKDLYLFKTSFVKDKFAIYLNLDIDVFQIQRRDNFRFVFPKSISSKVIVKTKNNLIQIGNVYDLSKTGIRVCFKSSLENAKPDDLMDLEIKVMANDVVKTQAVLRHFKEETETLAGKKYSLFYYGFEFFQITKENEKLLYSINMDLYRNFLSKIGT